jgi:hypothetical protein
MRNLVSLLGVLVLVSSTGGGNTLRAAAPHEPAAPQSTSGDATGCLIPPPAPDWRCVSGIWIPPLEPATPPPSPSTITPQMISVGQEVTGNLHTGYFHTHGVVFPPVEELVYELTAPSDGTLIVQLSWDTDGGHISLQLEDEAFSSWPPTFGTLPVAAGQTYRVALSICCSWDLVDVSFVMTTSIISGPVLLPPQCSMFSPVSDWICVGEAWVPPGHPAAEGVVTFPQLAPLILIPPPPPPTGGATGCPTIRPGPDWVCVTGNWLPSDHPDALSAPANPTPQPPPPLAPTGCSTPDPFAGIPGMIGVCIGNNTWVPLGHPLARGGG